MRCPSCHSLRQVVIDTYTEGTSHHERSKIVTKIVMKSNIILRIRECLNKNCKERFWTKEEITVPH